MVLEKMARFVESIFVTDRDELRGPTVVAAVLAGAVAGYEITDDWAMEDWDARPQEPSSAYVEVFNQKAQNLQLLREDLVIMGKRQEIDAYEAKRAGKEWQESDADILTKHKMEQEIKTGSQELWSTTMLNTDLKEKDLSALMQNHSEIFNGYRMSTAGRTYALEECQIEEAQDVKEKAKLEQATSIASCTRSKTSDDATSFLGVVPGAIAGFAGVCFMGAGAGSAANSLRRRRENKKSKAGLNNN